MKSQVDTIKDTNSHESGMIARSMGATVKIIPGVLLVGGVTAAAYALRQIPGMGLLSPMILAIGIGILFHNTVSTPIQAKAGVQFALRRLLRLAIILLGLQLTITQVIEVGGRGMLIIAATLLATFQFTRWFGARLGVEPKLAELIAAGTSICGASAVIATNTVTRGSDEDVAYAVACVTVFGSLAMFVLPFLGGLLQLDAHTFGLWSGASIHEIAQVVAAAFQRGQEAGEFGTIAKLSRVILLAPLVLGLGWLARRAAARKGGDEAGHGQVPVPWFVIGFVALVALNSVISIPDAPKKILITLTAVLLTMALAAMGLETDLRKLRMKGVRPFLLGAMAWVFISCFSLVAITLFR